jgi:predicted metal-dependent phosphoesterase TrpH
VFARHTDCVLSGVLKVELHTHTADDPIDQIPHSTRDLIDRAAALGYDALAITLHDRQLHLDPWQAYAEERGIVLIPGIERTIEGKHVLLLNYTRAATEAVQSFDDLAQLKRSAPGLVVAPHPYFPAPTSLWSRLEQHGDLFDAVERNAMYTRLVDFNRPAERWAARHRKPMVGNGDVHRLAQLGTTFSLVDAAQRTPTAICEAVAAGRVEVRSEPLSALAAARIVKSMMVDTRLQGRTAPVRGVPRVGVDQARATTRGR